MTHRARTGLLALALIAGLGGCRGPLTGLRQTTQFVSGGEQFTLEFAPVDAAAAARVEAMVTRILPELQRWGGLNQPMRIHLLPSHALLEEAVDKPGYGWLRAWARYDDLFVQSPATWTLFGATDGELHELLLHELTHAVMYQQAATSTSWPRKGIPLWFREGMASFTARQGYRWPTLEDLASFYRAHPDADPVLRPEALLQGDYELAYAAAHHAFAFLVLRYGEEGVRSVLRELARGARFPEAFEAAIGLTPEAFTADFESYVRFRAFRSGAPLP